MEADEDRQQREDERRYGPLYDDFAGRYWHCTSWRGLQSIIAGGFILPNVGQFKASCPQTQSSYSLRKGVICVFDFVAPARDISLLHAWKWADFLRIWKPVTVALELSAQWVEGEGRLIRAAEAAAEPYDTAYRCPIVEAWVREPIPFDVVTSVRLVCADIPGLEVSRVKIDPPLTVERIDAARVRLVQAYRRRRHENSPNGGLTLTILRARRRACAK